MKARLLITLCWLLLAGMLTLALIAAPGTVAALQADTPTPTLVRAWDVHCYVLVEVDPTIPQAAANAAWLALRGMGQQIGQPDLITHFRVRPDLRAMIIESTFNPEELNRQTVINHVADATGYTRSQVDNNLTLAPFACWQGYAASRTAARQYLTDNAAEWEPEL